MTEQSESVHQTTVVPRWLWRLVTGFLVMLFIAVGMTISVTIVWIVLLTWNVAAGNKQRIEAVKEQKAFHREMLERIEKIEKSAERIEESTAPNGK